MVRKDDSLDPKNIKTAKNKTLRNTNWIQDLILIIKRKLTL